MPKLLLVIAFCLFAGSSGAQSAKKTVVATASIFADMAENIAGGHVTVKTIVPIGGDPHIYEPTPSDAQLAASADLILRNELTFEGWLYDLIANAGSKAKLVTVTEGIQPIESSYKNSADPHAWMDAANGLIYIENIKKALIALDPANREVYEINYGVYRKQLEDLDRYIFEEVKKIPEAQRILITSHDAFRYYGNRYGIRVEAVQGVSTEAEAQTSDVIRLNKLIQENKIPAVFVETTVNPKLLQQIASDNKVSIGGKLYSDSIGEKGSTAPSYLDMLKYNTDVIVAALSKPVADPSETKKEGSGWLLWVGVGAVLLAGFIFMIRKMNG